MRSHWQLQQLTFAELINHLRIGLYLQHTRFLIFLSLYYKHVRCKDWENSKLSGQISSIHWIVTGPFLRLFWAVGEQRGLSSYIEFSHLTSAERNFLNLMCELGKV